MKTVLAALLSLLLCPAMVLAQTPPAPTPQTPPKPSAPGPTTPQKTPPPAAPTASVTVIVTVTDGVGSPLPDVTVTADGPLNRSGTTDSGGTLRIQGMRVGTYRMRFDAEEYISFEKEITTRAGQRTLDVAVTLTPAPKVEPPPPPPAPPPSEPELPPSGEPKSMVLTDWLERNFINNREPQKESLIGCSGVGQALVWQIREPWTGRQHSGAEGMLYVIGGEGTLRLGEKDVPISAGSFAVVPRGTSYGFTRRGRNPLIVLAVLAGAPCAAG
jgi:Carboxypeptidase regulatory-like domain/Cupin domain